MIGEKKVSAKIVAGTLLVSGYKNDTSLEQNGVY